MSRTWGLVRDSASLERDTQRERDRCLTGACCGERDGAVSVDVCEHEYENHTQQ